MKYFFDTEFIEWAGDIDLVSLGVVSERGDTFYAESTLFDERNADNWVKENVLAKLRWAGNENSTKGYCNVSNIAQPEGLWKTEAFGPDSLIAESVLSWIRNVEGTSHPSPEFYAYYGAYDWVLFARLFGRLIELPEGFPMWVRDLKQMMWERGLDTEWKRTVCPDPEGEHDALVDAHWNKKLHNIIINHKNQ